MVELPRFEFTSDEEIEAFQPDDKGMELTGYVESLEGKKTLKTSQGHVLKFVVNNGSKNRVRVLIWGTKLATQYESLIKINTIVELTSGTLRTSNPHFRNPNDGTCSLEFNVQPQSTITIHGDYGRLPHAGRDVFKRIAFDDVMLEDGLVEIQGYIKSEFVEVLTSSVKFGQGVVVDGHYRLTVQITSFELDSSLKKGVPVILRGSMNKQVGGYFKVKDMSGVKVQDTEAMSPADLKKSIHSVLLVRTKRRAIISDPEDLNTNRKKIFKTIENQKNNVVRITVDKSKESIFNVMNDSDNESTIDDEVSSLPPKSPGNPNKENSKNI